MNNNLSNNLKKIRKDNDLSQESLADILGVSRQSISKWESNQAYPEMEKILQICKRFDVNINDLLNNDIKEIKGEVESKNNINKFMDDFLNFITKTINMFSSFDFKTKVKCLFEQVVIIGILCILFAILGNICNGLFGNLLRILPDNARYIVSGIFKDIYYVLAIIFSMIIFLHVFKTRYLDYYEIVDKKETIETSNNEEKVVEEVKESNKKIIIRDPNHSEYKFIKGLLNFIIGCIKAFTLLAIAFLSFILICFVIGLILCFLVSKTGLVFIGALLSVIGAIIINIIFILILINFVFNRKNDKKKMVISFIGSLIIVGVGVGLVSIGSLNFNVINETKTKPSNLVINMTENLVMDEYPTDIEFIEKNIDNIEVECMVTEYSDVYYSISNMNGYNEIHFWSSNSEPIKIIKEQIKHLNKYEIIDMENSISNIKVYTSKENIKKIKDNSKKYNEINKNIEELENEISSYQERITILEEENFNLRMSIEY